MSKQNLREADVMKFFTRALGKFDVRHLKNVVLLPIYDDDRLDLPPSMMNIESDRDIGVADRLVRTLAMARVVAQNGKINKKLMSKV